MMLLIKKFKSSNSQKEGSNPLSSYMRTAGFRLNVCACGGVVVSSEKSLSSIYNSVKQKPPSRDGGVPC